MPEFARLYPISACSIQKTKVRYLTVEIGFELGLFGFVCLISPNVQYRPTFSYLLFKEEVRSNCVNLTLGLFLQIGMICRILSTIVVLASPNRKACERPLGVNSNERVIWRGSKFSDDLIFIFYVYYS
jgi:hypothetical protein